MWIYGTTCRNPLKKPKQLAYIYSKKVTSHFLYIFSSLVLKRNMCCYQRITISDVYIVNQYMRPFQGFWRHLDKGAKKCIWF